MRLICSISFLTVLIFPITLPAASDCSGPWQTLKNRNGMGPCMALGLDSKRGVCRQGDTYETFCDDIKGGKYRICPGQRLCNSSAPPAINNNCNNWDYTYNQPCPPGFVNRDCRGGCER